MAFSSEVRFKIGADTSALSKGFVAAQSIAASAGQQIQKKLGLNDAIKGLMQGIGIGSVDAITNLVVAPFRLGAEKAQAMVDLTASLTENTYRWLGALGGPTKELELQVRQANEINRTIEIQKALIADLNSNPLNLISEEGRASIKTAEDGLNALILKQAELGTSAQIAALQDKRRLQSVQRQQQLEIDLANVELRHGTDLEKNTIRLTALQAEYNRLKTEGALPSSLQENLRQQSAIKRQNALAARAATERRDDILAQIDLQQKLSAAELRDASEAEKGQIRLNALKKEGQVIQRRLGIRSPEFLQNQAQQKAAEDKQKIDLNKNQKELKNSLAEVALAASGGGKTSKRGRTESERLAAEGESYLARARDQIAKGGSPDYIAQLTNWGAKTLERSGGMMMQGVSKVPTDQLGLLGPAFKTTEGLLTEIKDSLKATRVDSNR